MKRLRWAIRLSLLALLAWGVGFEPGWLQQRQLTLAVPGWAGPPLTIAVASDLHVGAPHAGLPLLRRVVDEINGARPDLILLPGDFVIQRILGGAYVAPETLAAELARLQAPLGVYATLGNHDWWEGGPRVRQALEAAGIVVLDNAAVPLPGGKFWLVGIGDDMTGHAQPARAFAQVPADAPAIVMMHDPANAPELPRPALVAFAGHTHGGQVRLPWFGALVAPGRTPRQHAYGWLPGVATPTFVTAGVGMSIVPIRLNCPPETVVLRIHGKETA